MNEKPLLIIGVGNKILTDDGIGIRLTEDLRNRFDPAEVDFRTACCGGLEIVEMMQGYDEVIILDAIKTADGKAGKIYNYSLADFKETLHTSSFHDISFLIALEFGKQSGLKVPENIRILAVEIVEDRVFDENFSPQIQNCYHQIREKVYTILRKDLEIRQVRVGEPVIQG